MTRVISPLIVWAGLVLMWMLLTRFSPGHLILGGLVAALAVRFHTRLTPEATGLRAIGPLLRLAGIVAVDIARSNLAVARLIVTGGRGGARTSGFLEIPLRARNPTALALLAVIITVTPGTAWIDYDSASGVVTLHVFDLIDLQDWQALIRDRYEAYLLEAFE